MKTLRIADTCGGWITCRSRFYTAHSVWSGDVSFREGINMMLCEVDQDGFPLSYLISMYECRPRDFVFEAPPSVFIDGQKSDMQTLATRSCYIDALYPLFSSKRKTVRQLIEQGLRRAEQKASFRDVQEMFELTDARVDRPLCQVGNEVFRAMPAIGYAHGKEVFCFPWMSDKQYRWFYSHISVATSMLAFLGKVVILPIGHPVYLQMKCGSS